jgi:hypothetical protein
MITDRAEPLLGMAQLSSAATGGESSVPGGPSCSVFDEVLVSRVKLWQGPLLAGLTWQGV